MITTALPLVCVTLAAIYLQPVAAQEKPVYHVLKALLIVYRAADDDSSTQLFFKGHDNFGVTRVSTAYADKNEGHPIQELLDDEGDIKGCSYTGQVHDGFYLVNPKPAQLNDNDCAIRDAPKAKSTYENHGTFEVVFDEGTIRYEVHKINIYPIDEPYPIDLWTHLRGSIYHIPKGDLTVYRGDESKSTVLFLRGKDTGGVNRITTVYAEVKEGYKVYEIKNSKDQPILCEYFAKVYGVYPLNPKQGFVVRSCNVKNAAKDKDTYQVPTIFEVRFNGRDKLIYRVDSVNFSPIADLEKMKP